MTERFIGLMSGTSLDGVDGVIAQWQDGRMEVLQYASTGFAPELRAELLALNSAGEHELHRAALAGNALARSYAQVVDRLLARSQLQPGDITAIGAHGQTVRHQPGLWDGTGYTLQLNSPALLAELSGITVVADFRSRDVAAGGQGAPLVPAFHHSVFGGAGALGSPRWVLNIGGISNISRLEGDDIRGWDCGPGNALMDHWCQLNTGNPYDDGGHWAASGQVIPDLLAAFMEEPFFQLPPPKSTGRDLFNPAWLAPLLERHAPGAAPADVQASLAAFTALAIAQDMQRHGAAEGQTLIVCGGGALNQHLLQRLADLLPGIAVDSSAEHGLPPVQVEASAFAWLARQCWQSLPGNLPAVTGARGPRVLGAIYPR